MAFSNYSSLFKCGLLSEGSSPSYATAPWATEYCGPRRGSLPSIDAFSEISDFSAQLLSPSKSTASTAESVTPGDGSFYFTFKKKRNPAEHRSFLSLDLAESQSLRSVSIKSKDKAAAIAKRGQKTESSLFSPTFSHSFVPIFSPPALTSPPGSPMSIRSTADPTHPVGPKPSVSGPGRPPSIIHAPSPRRGSYAFPTSPTSSIHTLIQRDLSPMRFADPSPPPFSTGTSEIDGGSEKSLSSEVLSRSSTVSSGYRRAQRWDTLKRLEGRGADGAVGRLKPRLSQNFMHLTDDEEDEEMTGQCSSGRGMNVIVEDLAGEAENRCRQPSISGDLKGQGLSVSINGQPWYNLTPRQSAWGVLFGGEVDGDIDVEVDKIFGLDKMSQLQPDSPRSDDGAPRKPKRSKRSYSPRSPREQRKDDTLFASSVPFPNQRTPSRSLVHLHPLDFSASTSRTSQSPSSTRSASRSPSQSQTQSRSSSRTSKPAERSTGLPTSNQESYIRLRTVSDLGSSSPHSLVQRQESRNNLHHPNHSQHHHKSQQHQKSTRSSQKQGWKKPARLELRLDWLPVDGPSFIDMRDESLETDSRSDSWRSLFEVPCAA